MAARNCLRVAEDLLFGARQRDYGDPVKMHQRVAHMWTAIVGTHITAKQVALMMAALKIARESVHATPDNLDDGCAYLAIAEMIEGGRPFDGSAEEE